MMVSLYKTRTLCESGQALELSQGHSLRLASSRPAKNSSFARTALDRRLRGTQGIQTVRNHKIGWRPCISELGICCRHLGSDRESCMAQKYQVSFDRPTCSGDSATSLTTHPMLCGSTVPIETRLFLPRPCPTRHIGCFLKTLLVNSAIVPPQGCSAFQRPHLVGFKETKMTSS